MHLTMREIHLDYEAIDLGDILLNDTFPKVTPSSSLLSVKLIYDNAYKTERSLGSFGRYQSNYTG